VSNLLPVFKCSPAEPRFNYDYSAEEIANSVVKYYLPRLKRFSSMVSFTLILTRKC
jgi:hypothetical protein